MVTRANGNVGESHQMSQRRTIPVLSEHSWTGLLQKTNSLRSSILSGFAFFFFFFSPGGEQEIKKIIMVAAGCCKAINLAVPPFPFCGHFSATGLKQRRREYDSSSFKSENIVFGLWLSSLVFNPYAAFNSGCSVQFGILMMLYLRRLASLVS